MVKTRLLIKGPRRKRGWVSPQEIPGKLQKEERGGIPKCRKYPLEGAVDDPAAVRCSLVR